MPHLALRNARESRGITLTEACKTTYFCSNGMGTQMETGKRNIPEDTLERAVADFDNARLRMEAGRKMTQKAFIGPWLNNVNLDELHVGEKYKEESEEVYPLIYELLPRLINNPNKKDLIPVVEQVIEQIIDAERCAETLIVVLCERFGLSITSQYAKHDKKLIARGYIDPKREGPQDRRPR